MCPHCPSNEHRRAVMRIGGDYWCEKCMPEVWALMQAAKEAHSWMAGEGEYSGYWDSAEKLRRAIAALEVSLWSL